MIQILKASAGSGKTYNLAREYIRLLLQARDPQAYRHILAVTFTNKATDEMKRRILQELFLLASDPASSGYREDFIPSVFPSEDALRRRASMQLSGILHDYSAFSVSTIDKFFQQTLRAFSREIGQFASYQVELDKAGLLQETVDRILDALSEEDRSLLDWLTDSVKTDLERGARVNLEPHLLSVALSLTSGDHKVAVERYGIDEDRAFSKDRLTQVRKGCDALVRSYGEEVRAAAAAVLYVLRENGVPPEESNRGFLKALYAYLEPDPHALLAPPSATFLEKAADPSKWFAKSKDHFRQALEGVLEAPLEAFCSLFGNRYKAYATARVIRGQVYGLGIAGELRQAFTALQREKNVISIDDSNTILRDIIDGSDAPFVYEKLGVRYEHFLLDEFQDTSLIQWENFRPLLQNSLSGGFDNLVVGDVKQSIYRWRGSDWRLLDSQLSRELGSGGEKETVLKGNYRTCREIVAFNNAFFPWAAAELDRLLGEEGGIASLYKDVEQDVRFRDPAPGSVETVFCEDREAEMDAVLSTIRDLREAGAQYGDIAVLVRGNAEGSGIAARLVREGIPVVSDDSLFVKSSVTVRRLVSQLSLVDRPPREGEESVGGFLARSMEIRIPEHYHSLVDLAESVLRDLKEADLASFEAEVPYIQSFMDYLQDWSEGSGNNLSAFLRDWEDASPKIASPDEGTSVRVMTVHKAKGLEFPFVIFPFAEKVTLYKNASCWCRPEVEGTPLDAFADGVYQVDLGASSEETLFAEDYRRERRLQFIDNINVFYVALTRAKYGLKIISLRPPKKILEGGRDWKDFSQLLYGFTGAGESFRGERYDFSRMPRKASPVRRLEAGYPSFTPAERGRLRCSPEAVDYFGPDGSVGPHASNRLRGLVLHKVLSGVTVPEDLPEAVEKIVRTGELAPEDRQLTLRFLRDEVASVDGRGWFPADASQVLNEVTVLGTDGRESRPDRVVLHPGGKVSIVDYKFGAPEGRYTAQLTRYARLFREMGYAPVEAFLWYIREGAEDEIVEVK